MEWVGLDIELNDLDQGLPHLKRDLLRLGAPAGTTFQFERDGERVTESIH